MKGCVYVLCCLACLICSTAYANCQKSLSSRAQYDGLVNQVAKKVKLDPALIHAVIRQESCYDPRAVSHAGAMGMMQLMPATAKRFSVKNAFVAEDNILAGSQYLAWLDKRFKGNLRLVLAGYNAGEGAVDKYRGIPPYRETRHYVRKVLQYYYQYKNLKPKKYKNRKQTPYSGLTGRTVSPRQKKRLPSGLHMARLQPKPVKPKPKQRPVSVRDIAIGQRVRIRSLSLVRNTVRSGYTRIVARKKMEAKYDPAS